MTAADPDCKACCAPGAYIEHTCVSPEGRTAIAELVRKHGRAGAYERIVAFIERLAKEPTS